MKTVVEMAREAGFNKNELAYLGDNFIRLVDLARADERKVCLDIADDCAESDMHASMVANFIRARSNT